MEIIKKCRLKQISEELASIYSHFSEGEEPIGNKVCKRKSSSELDLIKHKSEQHSVYSYYENPYSFPSSNSLNSPYESNQSDNYYINKDNNKSKRILRNMIKAKNFNNIFEDDEEDINEEFDLKYLENYNFKKMFGNSCEKNKYKIERIKSSQIFKDADNQSVPEQEMIKEGFISSENLYEKINSNFSKGLKINEVINLTSDASSILEENDSLKHSLNKITHYNNNHNKSESKQQKILQDQYNKNLIDNRIYLSDQIKNLPFKKYKEDMIPFEEIKNTEYILNTEKIEQRIHNSDLYNDFKLDGIDLPNVSRYIRLKSSIDNIKPVDYNSSLVPCSAGINNLSRLLHEDFNSNKISIDPVQHNNVNQDPLLGQVIADSGNRKNNTSDGIESIQMSNLYSYVAGLNNSELQDHNKLKTESLEKENPFFEIEFMNNKKNITVLKLYNSDIEKLSDHCYLNDNIIFFYMK